MCVYRLAQGKEAWARVLGAVSERLKLQRAVDAEALQNATSAQDRKKQMKAASADAEKVALTGKEGPRKGRKSRGRCDKVGGRDRAPGVTNGEKAERKQGKRVNTGTREGECEAAGAGGQGSLGGRLRERVQALRSMDSDAVEKT
jgi:hypothetical protein